MREKIRYLLVITILLGLSAISHAQGEQEQNAVRRYSDSLERIKMRDSLGVSDEAIIQVFLARDSMFASVSGIRSNNQLSASEQDVQISVLRTALNNRIAAILGQSAYRHYLKMIRRSLKERNSKVSQPLAGETAD